MIIDPIPLAGPSITHREIECVADAAAVCWNLRQGEYVQRFQAAMRAHTGRQFALAVTHRAAALHLALLAMGVGHGDEVLVPEIADASVPMSVLYTGARPVFCDVDPLTLCISAESAAQKITAASKVLVPVHMFGQPCDMAPLLELADRHGLAVLEDATQAMGARYRGQVAGSLGRISIFGCNDPEALICGESGVLLSDDPRIAALAAKLGSLGRSGKNPMVHDAVGFAYGLADTQAALNVAQMERLPELLAQKAAILDWYRKHLDGLGGIRLNAEVPDTSSSWLMPVLFVDDATVLRTEFMRRLLASGVVCKPVPYPLSSMPVFAQREKADNPVAYSTGARAILLPGGHNRTEEEVAYVCGVVRALLADRQVPRASVKPTGWLQYKSDVLEAIAAIKQDGLTLPFSHDGGNYALRALTGHDVTDPDMVAFFAELRRANMHALLRHGDVTDEYMGATLANYANRARDFLLFLVVGGDTVYGHMGLDDFAFRSRECVAEGFMMQKDAPRGLAAAASTKMYAWAREKLGIVRVFNHVVGSNKAARLLAASQGFREINRTALYRQELPDGAVFRPMYIQGHDTPDEYFVFSAKNL